MRTSTIQRSAGDTMAASGYRGLVLDRLATQGAMMLGAEQSCIFVHDRRDPDTAIVAAAHGTDEAIVGKRVPVELEYSRARGGALVQLSWDGDDQGALSVGGTHTSTALLDAFAPMVAAAISHAQARADGTPDVRGQIAGLFAALDKHDGYTGRHSHDVMARARSLGSLMGMKAADLAELEVAALLHDVGKLLVPGSILTKPGRLTPGEHERMAEHPALGAQMLARVPRLEVVATIVRHHHERWDGAGYPDGLAGTRIPLASRVIAVCDSYNAMTSARPYRRALSQSEALAELRTNAGRQFDPDAAFAAGEIFDRRVAA